MILHGIALSGSFSSCPTSTTVASRGEHRTFALFPWLGCDRLCLLLTQSLDKESENVGMLEGFVASPRRFTLPSPLLHISGNAAQTGKDEVFQKKKTSASPIPSWMKFRSDPRSGRDKLLPQHPQVNGAGAA